MSKTPVSTLQEYMAGQARGLPEYVLVSQSSGSQSPSFTYRVICVGRSAEGTATNKKEAKHNAAKAMLKLLSDNSVDGQIKPVVSAALPVQISPMKLTNSYYTPGVDKTFHDNIFINSVGKLAEYCVSYKLKSPEYITSNTSGPDHMRMFTIKCTIGTFSAEGVANTKKQAKHNAAQSMYQKLVTTTTSETLHSLCSPDIIKKCTEEAEIAMRNIEILDVKMEKPSVPVHKSAERAVELFPKLRVKQSTKIVKSIGPKDYHVALKNSVPLANREAAQRNLRTGIPNSMKQLTDALKKLNLTIDFPIAKRMGMHYVVSCTLNSVPVIREMGVKKTLDEAKEDAIGRMKNTVELLLM